MISSPSLQDISSSKSERRGWCLKEGTVKVAGNDRWQWSQLKWVLCLYEMQGWILGKLRYLPYGLCIKGLVECQDVEAWKRVIQTGEWDNTCTKCACGRKEDLGCSGKDAARTSLSGSQKLDVSIRILGGKKRHIERKWKRPQERDYFKGKCEVKESQQKMTKNPRACKRGKLLQSLDQKGQEEGEVSSTHEVCGCWEAGEEYRSHPDLYLLLPSHLLNQPEARGQGD